MSIVGAILFTFGQITLFAILYVVGVIVSLVGQSHLINPFTNPCGELTRAPFAGTGFLMGFARQFHSMMDPVRRYAAAVFLLCIALTFVFAFAVEIE